MKMKKTFNMLLIVLYVEIDLKRPKIMKKKQRNIRRFAIIVISQVSIEGVLIAFVI